MNAGVYGLSGLMFVRKYQFITFAGTSEQGAALEPGTLAVHLRATADCFVAIGTDPTAAAPSGEKVKTNGFGMVANQELTIAIPRGSDTSPLKVAAIQSSGGGNLHIYELTTV